jgi:hypothetical protein
MQCLLENGTQNRRRVSPETLQYFRELGCIVELDGYDMSVITAPPEAIERLQAAYGGGMADE